MRVIQNETVRLAELATVANGYHQITDVVLRDCTLIGPCLLAAVSDVALRNNNFGAPGGFEGLYLTLPASGLVPAGAIVLRRATIERCRTESVSFIGPENFVQQAGADVLAG